MATSSDTSSDTSAIKTTNNSAKGCPDCDLAIHDIDAVYCKACGGKLKLLSSRLEI
jgi:rRNA maturation endonuclease Nob1